MTFSGAGGINVAEADAPEETDDSEAVDDSADEAASDATEAEASDDEEAEIFDDDEACGLPFTLSLSPQPLSHISAAKSTSCVLFIALLR